MDTTRRTLLLALLAAMVTTLLAPTALAGARHQTAQVSWHPQQAALGNSGVVEGATARLTRNDNGIAYELRTNSLTPGHAYTLWLITVSNPEACSDSPCGAGDILQNPDVNGQVRFAAGNVAGGSGRVTLSGHVREGEVDGWLPDRSLADARTAEVHLTINDHGPALSAHMPGMIRTYRGGCSDDSPFPGVFPDTALADGEPGPNICRLAQSAAFVAE